MGFIKYILALLLLSAVCIASLEAQRLGGSYLGLRLNDVTQERAKALNLNVDVSGVEVADVQQNAAADQAGIRQGDVLTSYNGEKVLGVQQFVRLVSETPPGRKVHIVCWRGGAQKDIMVTTGEPRAFAAPTEVEVRHMQIRDIPSPMMLWRNLTLGIESEEMNEQLAQAFGVKQGILVWSVAVSYPAHRAGLRAGDVVTGFCGHPIRSPRDFGLILEMQTAQKAISIDVVRDRKPVSISIPFDGDR